jgi:hypothetical protein
MRCTVELCDNMYTNVCSETNMMHYLSSVYSVTIPLHVSGLLVAHHQEVTMYMRNSWYVLYVLVDSMEVHCIQAQLQSTETYNTYQLLHIHIVTTNGWATGTPETCRGRVTE